MSTPSYDRFSFEEPVRPQRSKRGFLVSQALLFTPLAIVMAVGLVYAIVSIAGGETGFVVLLVVSGILFVALGFQAVHFLRDLTCKPMSTEGEVTKKWTKANLMFFFVPSYYIAVEGRIYSLSRAQYRILLEDDLVRLHHYPHSLTVEHIERYDTIDKKFVPAE